MSWEDTVVHSSKCAYHGYMTGGSLGERRIHYACTCGREAQAEKSYKAGQEAERTQAYHDGLADGVARGRMQVLEEMRSGDTPLLSVLMSAKREAKREVVEWIEEHAMRGTSLLGENPLLMEVEWQAYLKKEGIDSPP